MPSANVLTLCDALVSRIEAALDAPADATVSREYVTAQTVPSAAGLRVWVFPVQDEREPRTRAEDEWTYRVAVVVTDYYPDAAPVPAGWMDDRKAFAEGKVTASLTLTHGTFDFDGRRVWSVPTEQPVFDAEALAAKKWFWWEAVFEFRELLTA